MEQLGAFAALTDVSLELADVVRQVVLTRFDAADVRKFVIPGRPQPKQRARVVMRRGRGRGAFPMGITPQETIDGEQRVRDAFREAFPNHKPWVRPVVAILRFHVPDLTHRDFDNLAKLVTDALNRRRKPTDRSDPTHAWVDDSQVVLCVIAKALDREHPRTEVMLCALPWHLPCSMFPKRKRAR